MLYPSASRATSGMLNPSVLPEPVWARPRMSAPARASGSVAAWTGRGVVMPTWASAVTMGAGTPSSAKVAEVVMGTGAAGAAADTGAAADAADTGAAVNTAGATVERAGAGSERAGAAADTAGAVMSAGALRRRCLRRLGRGWPVAMPSGMPTEFSAGRAVKR